MKKAIASCLTQAQIELARDLIADTNAIIQGYLIDTSVPNEPLNRADLSAREVRFAVDEHGFCSITVLVEEAAPECHHFNTYIRVGLGNKGWNLDTVFCTTEW